MTQLFDFPLDVQDLAIQAEARLPSSSRGHLGDTPNLVTVEIIADAIMADRAARIDASGLTQRQAECLAFIARHQREHDGLTPTFDEIKDALGLASKSGICRLLDGLEDRGRIQRLPNRARAITIIATSAT